MNERIRELAEQAWIETSYPGSCRVVREWCKETFAEWIVRECARIVINNGIATAIHDQMVRQDCVNDIKQHFGVEE